MRIAIVGGGILGVTTALLAVRRGWDVEIFEASPALWSQSSAANEGKIHLGLIFALGDEGTREVMLRGALSFATLVDQAAGAPLPWPEFTSDPFDYLVMPDSLLTAGELGGLYRAQNSCFDRLRRELGDRYLGGTISSLVDPTPRPHAGSGLPAFATSERAVDPMRLAPFMMAAIAAERQIRVRVNCRVVAIDAALDAGASSASVTWTSTEDPSAAKRSDSYDVVVNCAWDQQAALLPAHHQLRRNYRIKTAVRLPRLPTARTVTLVQGPYGDVVVHRDYTYVSWYPVGRLSLEHAVEPSPDAYWRLSDVSEHERLIRQQVEALQAVGVLSDHVGEGALVGGVIIGHGDRDIHTLASALHSRQEFGAERIGRMVVPLNFKFTTAPLAALRAVEQIQDRYVRPR